MNFDELNAEMGRNKMSIPKLAKLIGIDKKTLYSRFNAETEFKRGEIAAICKVLNIDKQNRNRIFFSELVS